ncbi:Uncharacterised protein [Burkholderia pseudomallei]|nr:Uncharacterised protein [Burkholderia pseudomallei]
MAMIVAGRFTTFEQAEAGARHLYGMRATSGRTTYRCSF